MRSADYISVEDFGFPQGWSSTGSPEARSRNYCEELERGGILFFSGPPFDLPAADREFLVAQKDAQNALHKNISYRPDEDQLNGFSGDEAARQRLHGIMKNYSAKITDFVNRFLIPYANRWQRDYASFRPSEEQGRQLPLRKRNDLLHVDAFPTRPTHGARILRVFTNINPDAKRVWQTTIDFEDLARKYAFDCGLPRSTGTNSAANGGHWKRVTSALGRVIGLRQLTRSDYDRFMLQFHNYLKENAAFQSQTAKATIEFPPLSTWLVFTDGVAHSVLSGRYALEQTFLIPPATLVAPEQAPFRVLESLARAPLV